MSSDISILYEDESLFVINKPSGIVVNDCDSQIGNETVQSWVRETYPNLFDKSITNDFNSRNGIVHRLDKQTSGVLIIAKNAESYLYLTGLFSERLVYKEYVGVVYGSDEFFKPGDKIVVDAPIARNPKDRMKFALVEGGKDAKTEINVLDSLEYKGETLSIVKCFPKTGRTHQIRVHLTALGHPIVGDELYSGRKRYKRNEENFKRQFLHARKISFILPDTDERVEIEAPIPKDMGIVLDLAKSYK